MLIGYARVSTTDQNLVLQKNALLHTGCERIYEDEISGTKDNRLGLNKALEKVPFICSIIIYGTIGIVLGAILKDFSKKGKEWN
jgi:hypothetical protein